MPTGLFGFEPFTISCLRLCRRSLSSSPAARGFVRCNHHRQAGANARLERLLGCDAGLTRNFGQLISKWTAHPNLVALDWDRAILKGLSVLCVSGAFANAPGRFVLAFVHTNR